MICFPSSFTTSSGCDFTKRSLQFIFGDWELLVVAFSSIRDFVISKESGGSPSCSILTQGQTGCVVLHRFLILQYTSAWEVELWHLCFIQIQPWPYSQQLDIPDYSICGVPIWCLKTVFPHRSMYYCANVSLPNHVRTGARTGLKFCCRYTWTPDLLLPQKDVLFKLEFTEDIIQTT